MRTRKKIIKVKAVQVTVNGKVVNVKPTFHQLLNQLTQDEKLAFRMKTGIIS